MTQEEININNTIIAEFMGASVEKWNAKDRLGDDVKNDAVYAYFDSNAIPIEELKYNSSWDWLMPVIEKCVEIGVGSQNPDFADAWELYFDETHQSFLNNDIKSVYNSVIKFIKIITKQI